MRPDVLAVVAHPDDESIWCGNVLASLAVAGRSVAALSMTHGDDPIRRAEFERACATLGIVPIMLAVVDDKRAELECSALDCDALFGDRLPDLLLTHGFDGEEHLHRHHIECGRHALAWAARRSIAALCFDPNEERRRREACKTSLVRCRVTGVAAEAKSAALACYASQAETIGTLLAPRSATETLLGDPQAFATLLRLGPGIAVERVAPPPASCAHEDERG